MSNLQLFNKTLTMERTQQYLQSVLGEKKSSFVNNITALVANSTALQECEPLSLMYAGIKATALDLPLDPNLGFAYVIPYNNKDGKVGQFQLGYRGFIQLAIRSGQFRTINVTDVREGEISSKDLISGTIEFTEAEKREEKPVIGYVAYFKLLNGFDKMLYMTKEQVELHAKRYSQTYSSKYDKTRESSKWTTDFDAMAKKTVLKLLLGKYAPLSVDMQTAIKADQASFDEKGQATYVDNMPTDLVQDVQEIEDKSKDIAAAAMAKAEAAKAKAVPMTNVPDDLPFDVE